VITVAFRPPRPATPSAVNYILQQNTPESKIPRTNTITRIPFLNKTCDVLSKQSFAVIPEHTGIVQFSTTELTPSVQLSPPFAGDGLSHCLSRDREPAPHVTEHELQSAQFDQCPSTEKKYLNDIKHLTVGKQLYSPSSFYYSIYKIQQLRIIA